MEKYLLVGLGNPGAKYAGTRHNIGFDILDVLAEKKSAVWQTERYGDIATIKLKGRTVILLKPSTYMNLSGKAVRYWQEKENVSIDNTLVIVDDVALPLGLLRMKKKGSDAGHNGISHIIEILQTNQFPRLRVGIGNDFAKGYQVQYVLGRWESAEIESLRPKVDKAVQMCISFVMMGIERTMNEFNEKQAPPPKTNETQEQDNKKGPE
jgi:PTH1 family peptidyl-tRNA hydrolase